MSEKEKKQFFVNKYKFGSTEYNFESPRLDKKINLKLFKSDVQVLDLLANFYGVPRSLIVNHLLQTVLLKELKAIEDKDVRLLLAQVADDRSGCNDLNYSWWDLIDPPEHHEFIGMEIGGYTYECSHTYHQILKLLQNADETLKNIDIAISENNRHAE